MKTFKQVMVMTAIGLALGSRAQASTLYTAPAVASFGNATLYCVAVNVRNTPLTVSIAALDYSGAAVDSAGPTVVPPGVDFQIPSASGAYCRFTVVGRKSSVRAQAQYNSNSSFHNTITVPAQ